MFPSIPSLAVVASFALSVVHAGLVVSQLVLNQAGDSPAEPADRSPPPEANLDGTESPPPVSAESAPNRKVPLRTTGDFPTKTPVKPKRRPGRIERIDHTRLDQYRPPAETPWFNVPEVREQLRMDSLQFDNLTGTYSRLWSRYNDVMSKYPDNLARAERFQKEQIALNHFQGDLNKSVDHILSEPFARHRFKQLDWQYKMYDTFNDPVVRTKLKLTDEQLRKLNLYRREWNRELLQYESNFRDSPEVVRKKFLDSRLDAQRTIMAVLTPEQEILWNELLGEPYNFGFDTYYGPVGSP